MAFEAHIGMELLSELDHLRLIPFQDGNLVQSVTIAAVGSIPVPCEDGFSVDAFEVAIVAMAGGTFFDDPFLIPFPGGHLVDILVAVFTLNVINEVGARIMLCPLLLMAAMTGDWLRMNSGTLRLRVGFDIGNIPMTAIAGIGSMDRLGELSFIDLVTMATEAFRIVDTFITVFPASDDELLDLLERF